MSDFFQNGLLTALHDLGRMNGEQLERLLWPAAERRPVSLILPVTAEDMQAAPFGQIVAELRGANYLHSIVVVLGVAPDVEQYRQTVNIVSQLGGKAKVIWTDGARVQKLYGALKSAGLSLGEPGKGRAVWTAFGYLLARPTVKAFVLHDCDIVDYDRSMVARLCLPLIHPGLDFEFCKAYYARFTDRMHGRVVRLLVTPLLRALMAILGYDRFLVYLDSFRYPLSGEIAVTSTLARYNRIPSDWGLELGTLAEVYRNTSTKRVCQVDLCRRYEHKHQSLSLDNVNEGLMKMARELSVTILRTLASMGLVFPERFFPSLHSAYLRAAQDAIRQYHADSVINDLSFDRHAEESAVEAFALQIMDAGRAFLEDPAGGQPIPNWNRVLAALPEFPDELQQAVADDEKEFGT